MTQTITHPAHAQSKPNGESLTHASLRAETERLLRDIAFVLEMTERVRDEIVTPAPADEPVLV